MQKRLNLYKIKISDIFFENLVDKLKILCYYNIVFGGIAQLARASALHAEGRRFESDYLHQQYIMCLSKVHIPLWANIMDCSSVG